MAQPVDLRAALAQMERNAEYTKRELENAKCMRAHWSQRVEALTQQYHGYFFGAQNLKSALSYEIEIHDEEPDQEG
jgi:hypothetical protein